MLGFKSLTFSLSINIKIDPTHEGFHQLTQFKFFVKTDHLGFLYKIDMEFEVVD